MFTGAWAKAWCLLIHVEASLSLSLCLHVLLSISSCEKERDVSTCIRRHQPFALAPVPYTKAPRRAVRPFVVKLTTPSTYSALGVRGLASTSTLGNVHVQVAQGGRASPTHSCQP